MQLHKRHLSGLSSLQPEQLEAIAQVGRLLATFVRSEEKSAGVILFWDQIFRLHKKHKKDREQEQKKRQKEAEKSRARPFTWKDLIKSPIQ